jgi:hypothetical protein
VFGVHAGHCGPDGTANFESGARIAVLPDHRSWVIWFTNCSRFRMVRLWYGFGALRFQRNGP